MPVATYRTVTTMIARALIFGHSSTTSINRIGSPQNQGRLSTSKPIHRFTNITFVDREPFRGYPAASTAPVGADQGTGPRARDSTDGSPCQSVHHGVDRY